MEIIREQADVLVVGGGTAGVVAAIQAARAGARTVLVEMTGQLGGTTTNGGVSWPGHFFSGDRQVIAGIGWELVTRCKTLNGDPPAEWATPAAGSPSKSYSVNRYLYAALAEEAAVQAGVIVHYHELVMEVREQGDHWCVGTAGKSVRHEIEARELIDCTGDADVVHMLGFARERSPVRQPGTLTFMLEGYDAGQLDPAVVQTLADAAWQEGRLQVGDYTFGRQGQFIGLLRSRGINQPHVINADSSTSVTLTETNLAARRSLLRLLRFIRTLPGCEGARLAWACADTGVRETVRIVGETTITHADYVGGRVFPDAVCYSLFFIDVHEDEGIYTEPQPAGVVPTIPLGALIPRGSRRLLAAGRCVASDRLANSALRVQPSCMAMGQAAGAAAALAVQNGCASRDVPLKAIRQLLTQHGAIVPGAGPD
jgi:glycine/D-amino acid oxidase-like deaminating enzyme